MIMNTFYVSLLIVLVIAIFLYVYYLFTRPVRFKYGGRDMRMTKEQKMIWDGLTIGQRRKAMQDCDRINKGMKPLK